MDALPQELIDLIIWNLDVREQPLTERFPVVTPVARKDVLASRLIERRWRDSKVLKALFTQVFGETPVVWQDPRLPTLEAIGASAWGDRMTMLSICAMDLSLATKETSARGGDYRDMVEEETTAPPITEFLTRLLRNVSNVQYMRYYPIHPKCLNGTWPIWKVPLCDK